MKGNVMEILQKIVDKKVEHYKTDFTQYDKEIFETPGHYVWIARQCGTNLSAYDDVSCTYEYFRDDENVDYYDVVIDKNKMGTVKLIPFEKREKLKKFYIEIKRKANNWYGYVTIYETKLHARTIEDATRMGKKLDQFDPLKNFIEVTPA